MKKIVVLFIISLFVCHIQAQDLDEKKLNRKEKKEIRKKEDNEKLKSLYTLVQGRVWVIRANDVRAINGNSVNISPDMNFVYVTDTKGVVQLAFQELIGLGENNIGGITVEGEISRYDVKEFRDNQQIEYTIQVNSVNGGFVILNISVMSNARTTVIVSTHDGANFTFSGYIETQGGQPIIKGSSVK
jgi:hypothetical protein